MIEIKNTRSTDSLTRRNFLQKVLALFGAVGATGFTPAVRMLSISADVEAFRTVKIDLSGIEKGTKPLVAEWRGAPVFVLHRDQKMIDTAANSLGTTDPQPDQERVKKAEWLIVSGVCKHLGCIPEFEPDSEKGIAWFCHCHGSQYDISGRVIHGPAVQNLDVPPYYFISDTEILVGEDEPKQKA